jgi:hypothetical protein
MPAGRRRSQGVESGAVLPAIPYLRLRATLSAEEAVVLPAFLGSMLRGAFGHALRRMVCVMGPEQACAECGLRQACAYTRIFEPYVEGEPPPFLRGIDQAVRPYVFEPLDEGGRLAPGEALRFDLLLFGQAAELAAYTVLAVERMARVGLGARRAPFRLQKVEALSPDGSAQEVFRAGAPLSGARITAGVPEAVPLPEGEVTLRFETPLRIKVRDHLNDRPRFRDLAFNMLRRILELAHFHVPGAVIEWNFRPLLERADDVRILAVDLAWHDWERFSQRQGTTMKLGGLVGTVTLAGDLAPFNPLLRAAEVVHVGKGATFGLGKVSVVG